MILAAGRGERLRPLTDSCPKPLIKIAGIPLIEHHIQKLAKAGIKDIVINLAWLGEQIKAYLGNGEKWQVNISYSEETEGALETAGGIIKALPLLGCEPFLVVNGDIYCDYDFCSMPDLASQVDAHLWLIKNPEHNLDGDFSVQKGMLANKTADTTNFTFSGMAIYRPEFFSQQVNIEQKLPLAPMLRAGAENKKISATVSECFWVDVGTQERLTKLNQTLEQANNKLG